MPGVCGGSRRRAIAGLRRLVSPKGGEAPPDRGGDPEQAYAAGQALAAIDRLFADDPTALKIIAGLADGLTAAEIQRHYGISALECDTGRRRMRRALLRCGLGGLVR